MADKVGYKNTITDLENNMGSIVDIDLTTELDNINNSYCKPLVEEKQITHTLDDIDPDLNLLCQQNDNVQYNVNIMTILNKYYLALHFLPLTSILGALKKYVKFLGILNPLAPAPSIAAI